MAKEREGVGVDIQDISGDGKDRDVSFPFVDGSLFWPGASLQSKVKIGRLTECVAEWMTDGSWRLLPTHPPKNPPTATPPTHVRLLILYLISEQQS